jgi:hypothetical protein
MKEMGNAYRVLVGKPEGERPLKDIDIDMRIQLKRFVRNWDVRVWIGFDWRRIGSSSGLL